MEEATEKVTESERCVLCCDLPSKREKTSKKRFVSKLSRLERTKFFLAQLVFLSKRKNTHYSCLRPYVRFMMPGCRIRSNLGKILSSARTVRYVFSLPLASRTPNVTFTVFACERRNNERGILQRLLIRCFKMKEWVLSVFLVSLLWKCSIV